MYLASDDKDGDCIPCEPKTDFACLAEYDEDEEIMTQRVHWALDGGS